MTDSQNLSFLFPSPSHTDTPTRQQTRRRGGTGVCWYRISVHASTHTRTGPTKTKSLGVPLGPPPRVPQQAQASSP